MEKPRKQSIVRALDEDILHAIDGYGDDDESQIQKAKELFDLAIRRRRDIIGVMTVEQSLFARLFAMFVHSEVNISLRRGVAILLIELIKQRSETKRQIESLAETQWTGVGDVILGAAEELKWLAGGIIKAAASIGVDQNIFWRSDAPQSVINALPDCASRAWSKDFADFLDSNSSDISLSEEDTMFSVLFVNSKYQGRNNVRKSPGYLTVGQHLITFLQTSDSHGFEFVDVPIDERIASTKLLAPDGKTSLAQSHDPHTLEISVHGALWALMDNCAQKPADVIQIGFRDVLDAKSAQKLIMERVEAISALTEAETEVTSITPFPSRHKSQVSDLPSRPRPQSTPSGANTLSLVKKDGIGNDNFGLEKDEPALRASKPEQNNTNESENPASARYSGSRVTTEFHFSLPGIQSKALDTRNQESKTQIKDGAPTLNEQTRLTDPRNSLNEPPDAGVSSHINQMHSQRKAKTGAQADSVHSTITETRDADENHDKEPQPAQKQSKAKEDETNSNKPRGESAKAQTGPGSSTTMNSDRPMGSDHPESADLPTKSQTQRKLTKPKASPQRMTSIQTPAAKLRRQIQNAVSQSSKKKVANEKSLPVKRTKEPVTQDGKISKSNGDVQTSVYDIDTVLENNDEDKLTTQSIPKKNNKLDAFPEWKKARQVKPMTKRPKPKPKAAKVKSSAQPSNRSRIQPRRKAHEQVTYTEKGVNGLDEPSSEINDEPRKELIDDNSTKKPSVIQFTPKGPKNQGKGIRTKTKAQSSIAGALDYQDNGVPNVEKYTPTLRQPSETTFRGERANAPFYPSADAHGKYKLTDLMRKHGEKRSPPTHEVTPQPKRLKSDKASMIEGHDSDNANGIGSSEKSKRGEKITEARWEPTAANPEVNDIDLGLTADNDGEFMQIEHLEDSLPQGSQLSNRVDVNGSPHPTGTRFDVQRNPSTVKPIPKKPSPVIQAAVTSIKATSPLLSQVPKTAASFISVEKAKPGDGRPNRPSQKSNKEKNEFASLNKNKNEHPQTQSFKSHIAEIPDSPEGLEHQTKSAQTTPPSLHSTFSGVAIASPGAINKTKPNVEVIDLTRDATPPIQPESGSSVLHNGDSRYSPPPANPPVINRFLDQIKALYPPKVRNENVERSGETWDDTDETLINAPDYYVGESLNVSDPLTSTSQFMQYNIPVASMDANSSSIYSGSDDTAESSSVSSKANGGKDTHEKNTFQEPHQRGLVDALGKISEAFVSHIASKEAAIINQVNLYLCGSRKLIADMRSAHETELEQQFAYMDNKRNVLGRKLEIISGKLQQDYDTARVLKKRLD